MPHPLQSKGRPVNLYGSTSCYFGGDVLCIIDGYGYKDENGNIEWYDGYFPIDDEFNVTTVEEISEIT